jgi:hypothetical protein
MPPMPKSAEGLLKPDSTWRERSPGSAEQALEYALSYAALGWPVTPSCAHPTCPDSALHPANPAWRAEATTDAARVKALWAGRQAMGVIGALGGGVVLLEVTGPSCSRVLALLAARSAQAPVLRRDPVVGQRAERIFVLASSDGDRPRDPGVPGLQLVSEAVAVPLPAAPEGRVRWAATPNGAPLPPLAVVAAAVATVI